MRPSFLSSSDPRAPRRGLVRLSCTTSLQHMVVLMVRYLGWIGGSLTYKNLPMVGISDTELHLQRRRPWTRGLGPAALKDYEAIVAARASQLAHRLEEQHGTVNLGRWLNYFGCVSQLGDDLCIQTGLRLARYDFMSDMASVL